MGFPMAYKPIIHKGFTLKGDNDLINNWFLNRIGIIAEVSLSSN